jgi:hypothetical protein
MHIEKNCFVIMPFKPELNYFFLYVKKHIEEIHNTNCLRGDNDILTIPILEKIKSYIEKSDILIADCSGRNPNVFYELGIAHTLNKKVILISMDDIREAPTDVRHYEFIKYDLHNHEDFLNKLDNALRNAFVENYEHLYEKAIVFLNMFKKNSGLNIHPIRKDLFVAKIITNEKRKPIPDSEEELKLKQYLIPLIIDANSDFTIMESITKWLTED